MALLYGGKDEFLSSNSTGLEFILSSNSTRFLDKEITQLIHFNCGHAESGRGDIMMFYFHRLSIHLFFQVA